VGDKMGRNYFDMGETQYLVLSKESMPMKDVGTPGYMTMIPICSLTTTTSNQVHATLHSDQSSHIKQHKKSNDRERGK
jgi:hypothetical protein